MSDRSDNPPVRVLRIIGRMNVGGPAFLVMALMRGMEESRIHQKLVLGEVLSNEKEVDFQDFGFDYFRLICMSRELSPLADLKALKAIIVMIRRFKPDIVDTHTFKAGLLGRIASLLIPNRKPVLVHHYHGHLLYGYFGRAKKSIYIHIEKILSKFSDMLVVDSIKIATELISHGIGDTRIFQEILPGVAEPKLSQIPVRAGCGQYRIGFIGRFEPIKQPLHFLEVAKNLGQSKAKFDFQMVGEGSLSDLIDKTVKSQKLDVRVSPFVPNVYSVLSEIDILVMTSLNEGTPLIIMEAAYCGIPTISYNVGSVDRVIQNGKTGLICNGLPFEISEAIKVMTASEVIYKEFSSNAKKFAEAEFGLNRYTRAHEELYQRLLAK